MSNSNTEEWERKYRAIVRKMHKYEEHKAQKEKTNKKHHVKSNTRYF